jgi:hypothetical protein
MSPIRQAGASHAIAIASPETDVNVFKLPPFHPIVRLQTYPSKLDMRFKKPFAHAVVLNAVF